MTDVPPDLPPSDPPPDQSPPDDPALDIILGIHDRGASGAVWPATAKRIVDALRAAGLLQ